MRWIRRHWKFVAALFLGLGLSAIALLLFLFVPPAAPIIFALPLLGPLVVTMPHALAAVTITGTAFVATLTGAAVYNVLYQATRFLDWLFKPAARPVLKRMDMSEIDGEVDPAIREGYEAVGKQLKEKGSQSRQQEGHRRIEESKHTGGENKPQGLKLDSTRKPPDQEGNKKGNKEGSKEKPEGFEGFKPV